MKPIDCLQGTTWLQQLMNTRYMFERENPRIGVPLLQLALDVFGAPRDDHKRVLSNIYSGLVWHSVLSRDLPTILHYSQERFEIEDTICQERGGTTDALTAVAYNDLGMDYSLNHNFDKAFRHLHKSIEIRKSLPGYQKHWLFSPYLALGKAHLRLQNFSKAADCLEEALTDRTAAFGPNDRQSIR